MNKYIVGGILATISLMVIYGASASNRVADWVDGEKRQTALVDDRGSNRTVVSLNSTNADEGFTKKTTPGTTTPAANQANSDLTPLEQAGQLPQRQTIAVEAAGNTTPTGESDTAAPVVPDPQPTTPPAATTPQPAAPTTQAQPPVRALW